MSDPLLTFYALLKPRGTRVPVASLDHLPTDWAELKVALEEVMRRVYVEHGQTEAFVFLERHLPGKVTVQFSRGGYRERKVRYEREYEAAFKISYNPRTMSVEVPRATFNYTLLNVAEDYYWMEKGIRWRVPPLIPKEHRDLSDPRTYLLEPSTVRYASYRVQPKPIYAFDEKRFRFSYGYEPKRRPSYEKTPS